MRKILILGGAGFVGFHLAGKLAQDSENQITLCDNFWRGKQDAFFLDLLKKNPSIQSLSMDLTRRESYAPLVKEWDEVYLLAAVVGVKYTKEMPDFVLTTNTQIVLSALDWCREAKIGKLLFSSTSEAYAGIFSTPSAPIPTPETVPLCISEILNPRFCYAASKILGEAAITAYASRYNIPAVIVRYHNVYGPRMGFEHVLPELSLRIVRKETPFKIFGVNQTRAFCYVSDAVDGTIAAMRHQDRELKIYHIGDDQLEIRIGDLLQTLFKVSGYQPEKLEEIPAPSGSPERRCPDVSLARKELGYFPKVSLEEGMRKTFEWYKVNFPDGVPPR